MADAAYWLKGCSSLGFLRYAALVRIEEAEGGRFALVDLKEAVEPAAPAAPGAEMPTDPAEAAGHIYRIVQESLNNAERHAAAANVEIVLREGPEISSQTGERSRLIELSVMDDGVGLPPAASSGPLTGVGLVGMRERVVALGGTFSLAQRPEGGVELRASFSIRLETREQI